ncbi:hypothetical protein DRJ48_01705 [Candidatus Woesearchaeota archaeon]|nr:MAG: hypothetical protein DRJ48_01705 [Candidatus Woesearchaeota archaeon]
MIYFDDFKVEKVTPKYRTVNGAELDWDEKIENGNYIHHSKFSYHQQAIRTLTHLEAKVHATRIWMYGNDITNFTYDIGNYEQTSGKVKLYANYFASGNCSIQVRNETSSWEEIGWFNTTGWYEYTVPAKFYPTTGPIYVRAKETTGSASFQISDWIYNATLSGSPSDVYGYTKVSTLSNQNALTVSAWINPSSCTSGTIISKALRGAIGEYRMYCDTGNLYFAVMDHSLTWHSVSTSISTGQWSHVVGRWNGSQVALYLNGNSVSTTSSSSKTSYPVDVQIGTSEAVDGFEGLIDDIKIYNASLSADEIQKLYWEGINNRRRTIVSNETERRQNWTAAVWVSDNYLLSSAYTSNQLTIDRCPEIEGNMFIVRNTTGVNCTIVDTNGDLAIKGQLITGCTASPGVRDFVVQTSSQVVMWINHSNCNMCLLGSIYEDQSSVTAGTNEFLIRNGTSNYLLKIDSSGNLYTTGYIGWNCEI